MKKCKRIAIVVFLTGTVLICGCGGTKTTKKATSGEILKVEKTTPSDTEESSLELTSSEIGESVSETSESETMLTEQTYSITETNDIVYAVSVVNVRSKPNVEGDVVIVLNRNDVAERIGTLDNGWSKIRVNGNEGYVNTVYLTTNSPVPETTEQQNIPMPETTEQQNIQQNNEVITETTSVTDVPMPENAKSIAESYVGKTMDSLIQAIGNPSDSMHSASCYYEGETDGIFYYPGFTVYTHSVDGIDYVDYVE